MADVFICYVRSDRQVAEAISKKLGTWEVSTFFDEENIVFGGPIKKQIDEHIRKSTLTIVIWSKEAAKSLFVREEIRVALEAWENERLFLVRLDNAELPIGLRDIYCHDYSGMQPDKVAVSIAFSVLAIISPSKPWLPPAPPRSAPDYESALRLPAPARRRFPTWIKYFIPILLYLLGLGSIYYFFRPLEPQSLLTHTVLLLMGTITIILVLLASAEKMSAHLHEHKEFGSPPEGVLFISYSRDDRPKVNVIVNKLERSGLDIWLDTRREADAQRFARAIVQAIRASKACAFMCSSTAYSSDHVVRELYLADKYSKPMIPVEIENCTPSEDFEYFFSGLEFIPYRPVDRCVQVIIHRLQSAQPPKNI